MLAVSLFRRFWGLCLPILFLAGCQEADHTVLTPEQRGSALGFGQQPVRKALFQLADAIEARDMKRYARLVDSEQFRFVFDPQDVAESSDLPESWGWADERGALANLFADPRVVSISIDFQAGQAEDPLPSDEVPMHWRKVEVFAVELEIVLKDSGAEEGLVYRVSGGAATFFIEVPPGRRFSRPVPRVVEWRDRRVGELGGGGESGELTWGRIKGDYR